MSGKMRVGVRWGRAGVQGASDTASSLCKIQFIERKRSSRRGRFSASSSAQGYKIHHGSHLRKKEPLFCRSRGRLGVCNANNGDENGNTLESLFDKVVDDVDYYQLLGVERDAPFADIKSAYREMAKCCHPDIVGDRGEDLCILLNEAYRILGDEAERAAYDEELLWDEEMETGSLGNLLNDGYTGLPLSRWCGPGHKMTKAEEASDANDAVFVDELSCIGCKNCLFCAEATFRIEPEYGRARARTQWLNTREEIDIAIDSCPVDCIHWVKRDQLPALEFVMRNILHRVDVGIMMAGQGGGMANADVFEETATYMNQRQMQEQERDERLRTSKEERRRRQAAAVEIKDAVDASKRWNTAEGLKDALKNAFGGSDNGKRQRRGTERTAWQKEFNRACEQAKENENSNLEPQADHEYSHEYDGVPVERALVPIRVYNTDFSQSLFDSCHPNRGRRCR